MIRSAVPLISLLFATAVPAHQGVQNPGVMARMNAMLAVGKATDVLKDMASAKRSFDNDIAHAAKMAILEHLSRSEALFKDPHDDPKTEALPAIWEDFRGFKRALHSSERSVRKLDLRSIDTLRATLPAAGQGCSDCHKLYRRKK